MSGTIRTYRVRQKQVQLALGADLLVPAIKQFLAFGRIAIGLEVIVDQLDILEFRGFRRNGRQILFDGSWKDLASFICDCTSAVSAQSYHFLAASRLLRALDDRHRADFVTGTFARSDGLDGEAFSDLGNSIMHEDDAERRFAARRCLNRRRT